MEDLDDTRHDHVGAVTLGFSVSEVGNSVGATAKTVGRWQRGETTPRSRHLTQFVAFQSFRALLDAVFATPEHAMTWLRKSPGFRDGIPPLDMLRTGAITPLVGVLASIENGAFL